MRSMYEIFKTVLEINDREINNLTVSYVRNNLKSSSDIPVNLSGDDVDSICHDVFVDLLGRMSGEDSFQSKEQVKSYINQAVRRKISIHTTGLLSPIKMVNPKGGEGKKKGAALTHALYFRNTVFELDREDFSPESLEEFSKSEKASCLEPSLHQYNYNLNELLKLPVSKGMEIAQKRELDDLLRLDGIQDNQNRASVLSASHFGKIISEKITSVECPENKINFRYEILKEFFPEVSSLIFNGTLR